MQLLAMMQKAASVLLVQDVFKANTRTGNGSTATVTGGPGLSTRGGLVITKGRSGATSARWTDTARGATFSLDSTSTAAQATEATGLTAFTTDGFMLGADADYNTNTSTYVDYLIAKAPKFFDVVTYTGDGTGLRAFSHSLGQVPGMIFFKSTSGISGWSVCHRSLGDSGSLVLNTTAGNAGFGVTSGNTDSTFTTSVNNNGVTYVAYLFGHDTAADGLIKCDNFAANGSGAGSFDFGWTQGVQFIMLKCASSTGDWEIYDTARTAGFSGNDARIRPNLANAEDSVARLSFSGTTLSFAGLSASQTYIFAAIRAPA